ncbi:MAG: arginine--tRNA ligase [Gemmataceae bacterium]
MNISQAIEARFVAALSGLVDNPHEYASLIRQAQDPRHGDYQANCAMPLAKKLGKPPREVAQAIVARLDLGDLLQPPEIAGPGFINLRLRDDWVAAQLQRIARDERLGVAPANPPRTFVVDYSSPNVAKPLHVGHLRSTIIGDALTRLLRFLGHKVVTDNHLGDWGTQFGILLYGYKNLLDRDAYDRDPLAELARIYVEVRKQFKKKDEDDTEATDDPVQEACRQETAKLHAGDPENLALWQQFMPVCLDEIQQIYRRLDVLPFDHTYGESFYNAMLPGVVDDLLHRGLAQESKGAVVIPNANGLIPSTEEEIQKEEPPGLIRKRDGAFTYTTTDLATIKYRMTHFRPDAILYVVDSRQALHFKTLFAQARRWGFERVRLEYVSFGTVLDENGKPIKTREGTGTLLNELLDKAVAAAKQVHDQLTQEATARGEEELPLSDAEKQEIHLAVGIGAVKYADLSQARTSDYRFDLKKMTSTEGNTATYMQYAYVRNRGICRKSGIDEHLLRREAPVADLSTAHERTMGVKLLQLTEALDGAAAEYRPNLITAFLWDLSRVYSGFYQHCPVLKAPTRQLARSRLLLCDLTARTIRLGLELLGIRTVERM